jgi:hypothetical protein
MDDDALKWLWTSLKPEEAYEAADLPSLIDPDGAGKVFLRDELQEQAREEGSVLSFLSSARR